MKTVVLFISLVLVSVQCDREDVRNRINKLTSMLQDIREARASREQQWSSGDDVDDDDDDDDDDLLFDAPAKSSASPKVKTPATATLSSIENTTRLTIEIYDDTYAGVPVIIYRRQDIGVHVTDKGEVITNGVIYIHGGGWLGGISDIHLTNDLAGSLSNNAVLFSINYRLSRVAAFPGPFYDCLKATQAIMDRSKEWSIPKDRFVIMGGSAGANLAAAVTVELAKDPDHPGFRYQFIMDAPLQVLDFNSPSYLQVNERMQLDRRKMMGFWMYYVLGERPPRDLLAMENNRHVPSDIVLKYADVLDHSVLPNEYKKFIMTPKEIEQNRQDRRRKPLTKIEQRFWDEYGQVFLDPRFAPLMAESFGDLPPAIICAAENDILRDDTLLYAHALEKAGVDVQVFVDPDGYHGTFWMRCTQIGLCDAIDEAMDGFV